MYEFLREQGFDEEVATEITLRAMVNSFHASYVEIFDAAEEAGYTLPLTWDVLHQN